MKYQDPGPFRTKFQGNTVKPLIIDRCNHLHLDHKTPTVLQLFRKNVQGEKNWAVPGLYRH